MCAPTLTWDWLVLDLSYVLALLGGALVLRARQAHVGTWVLFAACSVAVGAFVFGVTYNLWQSLEQMGSTATMFAAASC